MRILYAYILIIVFAGCKEYPCERAFAGIGLVGFSRSETDTVLVKKYEKSTNFAALIDTILLDSTKYNYVTYNDTLRVLFSFGKDFGLTSDYDYKIILPSTGKEYQMTEITEDFRSMRYGFLGTDKVACVNSLRSYNVDGQTVTAQPYAHSLYLHK
jgi:hypothetical protein